MKLIFNEFEKLKRKKVGQKELNRAKEYLKGNLLMSLESTTNRMMQIAQSVIYFGRIKTIEETIEKISFITPIKCCFLLLYFFYSEPLTKMAE